MSALKPNTYESISKVWDVADEKEADKTGIDKEDKSYASMAESRGWAALKEYIESLKSGLDARLAESVLKSLSGDQIKNDALFSVLGKELLNKIVNKVEDAALTVQEIEHDRRSKR